MIYGSTNIKVLYNTMSITTKKVQEIINIPYTDDSYSIEKGKSATVITCQIKAESITELAIILNIFNSNDKQELNLSDIKYKKVITGESGKPKPINSDKTVWFIDAEFIALDPFAYDSETGDRLA